MNGESLEGERKQGTRWKTPKTCRERMTIGGCRGDGSYGRAGFDASNIA